MKFHSTSIHLRFTSGLASHYSADAHALDFGSDPNGSRLLINKWVEEKTKTKIKDLLPDGSITTMTAAVLVNAVYFKVQSHLAIPDPLATEFRL